jgi:hypothetical protein
MFLGSSCSVLACLCSTAPSESNKLMHSAFSIAVSKESLYIYFLCEYFGINIYIDLPFNRMAFYFVY